MDRRSLLRRSASIAFLASAGCLDQARMAPGVNETLEIHNAYPDPVTLHVTIEQGIAAPEDRPTVFDQAVTIRANQTRSLDVPGDDQYYLTVRRGGETHEFGTRPICDRAFTTIVLTPEGELQSHIRDCE